MIPFRALADRIEAYHEDLRVTEESATSLATERDAIVAVLVEMGLNVTSARRQVARMTVEVAWPGEQKAVGAIPAATMTEPLLNQDGRKIGTITQVIASASRTDFGTSHPAPVDSRHAIATNFPDEPMPEIPASLDRR